MRATRASFLGDIPVVTVCLQQPATQPNGKPVNGTHIQATQPTNIWITFPIHRLCSSVWLWILYTVQVIFKCDGRTTAISQWAMQTASQPATDHHNRKGGGREGETLRPRSPISTPSSIRSKLSSQSVSQWRILNGNKCMLLMDAGKCSTLTRCLSG